MIEKTVYDFLKTKFTNKTIVLELPSPIPSELIYIEKTGSHEENGIGYATIAIQSYHETLAKCATLNESVKTAMRDIISLDGVSAVDINSDYNFTDTTNKRYRYQAIFEITHY